MRMYNARVELDCPAEAMVGDPVLADLDAYHLVLGRSMLGRAELIMSLPAESLWQATSTVRALVAALDVTAVTVEGSDDFDRRSAVVEVPALLSVTEAAKLLGITRGGVQRRITAGKLPAVQVGDIWAIPAGAVAS